MSFVGKTPYQICKLWQDSKHNSAQELLDHLHTDPLAALAFKGNKGIMGQPRDFPPMGSGRFLMLAEDWLKNGDDIPFAGWVGTITQPDPSDANITRSSTLRQARHQASRWITF